MSYIHSDNSCFNLIEVLTKQREKYRIVWLCNIGVEEIWHPSTVRISDENENKIVNRIEELNLFLCREQDFIILRRFPSESYLLYLQSIGFSIPTIICPKRQDTYSYISDIVLNDNSIIDKLKTIAAENDDVIFIPYGISRLEHEIAEKCGLPMLDVSHEICVNINCKAHHKEIAQHLDLPVPEGKVCDSIQEIVDEYNRLVGLPSPFKEVVIKESHGASGKGSYIIKNEKDLKRYIAIFKRFNRNAISTKWVIEGWYEKNFDINYQLYISDNGYECMFSLKDQLVDDSVYFGSKFPASLGRKEFDQYISYSALIGNYLFANGYRGIAGIDSIITTNGKIFPMIEINGRFTLSTYFSFIGSIIGEFKFLFQYQRFVTEFPLEYQTICDILEQAGLLFSNFNKEGVIVCCSGTLPSNDTKIGDRYFGRLFTLIAANTWEKSALISRKLDSVIKTLGSG